MTVDAATKVEQRRALVRVIVVGFLAGNVMGVAITSYLGSYEGIEPVTRVVPSKLQQQVERDAVLREVLPPRQRVSSRKCTPSSSGSMP